MGSVRMSVDGVLTDGRAAALSLMSETVRVGTITDGTDPDTGDATEALENVVYGGDEGAPAQVKYVAETVSQTAGPGQIVNLQRPILKVPTGTPRLDEGLTVEVVGSRVDDLLVGRRYQIAGSPESGTTTAHRYPLTELT